MSTTIYSNIGGTAPAFRTLVAGGGIAIAGTPTTITISAVGGLTTLANEGVGTGLVFDATAAGIARLRTLAANTAPGNEGIVIATVGQEIVIGNVITGTNLGPPPGPTVGRLFVQKNASAQLEYRGLVAGVNVTLQEMADTIVINAAPGGAGISGLGNEGGGAEIFDTIVGTTAVLRTLVGTANGLTVTQNATTITIDNTLTGVNIGTGVSLFETKVGATLRFKSLIAGANVMLTPLANDITVDVTGVVTSLANEGGGAQVYDTLTMATLRTLLGTANGLTVTQGASTITVDNTLAGANLGAGTGVYSAKAGASLQFKSLIAGANVTLTPTATDITIATTGVLTTLANEGGGVGVFDSVVGTTANLKSLFIVAGGGLSLAGAATSITFDNVLTGTNPSVTVGRANIFISKTFSPATFNFRSLVAGANIVLTSGSPTANDITIAATGVLTALANEGGGAGVFDAVVGTTANLRSLLGTANGLTVTQGATTITVDNTLTGANPSVTGGKTDIFISKVGASLNFRSLVAGANITLTQASPTANDITIAASGVLTTLANEGGGAGIFDAVVGTTANLRSLVATTNGISVTQNATTITLDNTMTCANFGAGVGVFQSKTIGILNFRSLIGTTNQITAALSGSQILFSTPQDIATVSTPTFSSLTLSAATNQLVLGSGNTTTITAPAPSGSRTYTLPDFGGAGKFVLTSNTLPTIVRGTFVPTFIGSTSGSFATSSTLGWFNRVGDMLFWSVYIVWTSQSNAVGTALIGLAATGFTSWNSANYRPVVNVMYISKVAFSKQIVGAMGENSTFVSLLDLGGTINDSPTDLAVTSFNNAGGQLQVGGSFFVGP